MTIITLTATLFSISGEPNYLTLTWDDTSGTAELLGYFFENPADRYVLAEQADNAANDWTHRLHRRPVRTWSFLDSNRRTYAHAQFNPAAVKSVFGENA